jgi:Ca2+:H+ antiporter
MAEQWSRNPDSNSMVHSRWPVLSIAVPAGSLLLAGAINLTEGSAFRDPIWAEIVVVPLVATCVLLVTVFVALHHAEVVATRVGEPYGTLLLTIAVTTIEVSIILSMMLHGENNPSLARESVFSTVMIVCAGVVGLCLTLGGWRHRQQELKRQGTSAFLATLIALTVLTLVLPDFTLGAGPGRFTPVQLAFVSFLSLLLYGGFMFAQTIRHRNDFVEETLPQSAQAESGNDSIKATILHAGLLFIGLIGIVLLAEDVARGAETGLAAMKIAQGDAIIGALIATLVLLPEAVSAIRAALNNELQRSINVALGSALATIGLTIPAIAAGSLLTGRELTLGLSPGDMVLLVLILAISTQSFGTGRTTMLTGIVHLVVFVAYLMLIVIP